MSQVKTFRKKPVEIQAMEWPGGAEAANPVIDWILTGEYAASWTEAHEAYEGDDGSYPAEPECIRVNTLEGVMRAVPGDWIIRGVQGEFYPCKPDIFAATYDEVSA